jgi:hypothetical protein
MKIGVQRREKRSRKKKGMEDMTAPRGIGRGGHNRISIAEHLRKKSYRPSRHSRLLPSHPTMQRYDRLGDPIDERLCVSDAQRRRTLAGLPTGARRIAEDALDTYWDWPAEALSMLRSYALSMHRVTVLESAKRVNRTAVRTETLTAQRLRLALKLT